MFSGSATSCFIHKINGFAVKRSLRNIRKCLYLHHLAEVIESLVINFLLSFRLKKYQISRKTKFIRDFLKLPKLAIMPIFALEVLLRENKKIQ